MTEGDLEIIKRYQNDIYSLLDNAIEILKSFNKLDEVNNLVKEKNRLIRISTKVFNQE
jgi:hypothetical protein